MENWMSPGSGAKDTVQGGSQPHPSGCSLKVTRGWRHTSDDVQGHCSFQADYGCIVYGTASNTNLQQLDSIHNSGLELAPGAFCTSPVSSLYTKSNEAPLEERCLKLLCITIWKPVPASTIKGRETQFWWQGSHHTDAEGDHKCLKEAYGHILGDNACGQVTSVEGLLADVNRVCLWSSSWINDVGIWRYGI